MRWLKDERGATAVMAAMIMTALLGIVGLVIDGGALYQERRELRNAADAAALAIAEDCAVGALPCEPSTALATAAAYADENSRDGASAVAELSLDPAGRTVTVDVSTENPDGTTRVRPFFGQVVGWNGMTVHASATAAWGYPGTVRAMLPLIVSECEFPQGTPVPTPPRVLYFHDGNNAEPCNAVAGMDADGDGVLSGGFGWLLSGSSCDGIFHTGTWNSADPGSSPPSVCHPAAVGDLVGEEIVLPIFDDIEQVGAGGRYHIAGFGLFHVTGYNFGGLYKAPSVSGAPCSGDERCLSGYFTDGVVYEGEIGGSNWGFVIVKLIG